MVQEVDDIDALVGVSCLLIKEELQVHEVHHTSISDVDGVFVILALFSLASRLAGGNEFLVLFVIKVDSDAGLWAVQLYAAPAMIVSNSVIQS